MSKTIVSKAIRRNPQQNTTLIKKYESSLTKLFKDFKREALVALGNSRKLAPSDYEATYLFEDIESLIVNRITKPGMKLVIDHATVSYEGGVRFSTMNLDRLNIESSASLTQADWRAIDIIETRNLTALDGITNSMNAQIVRELSEGMNRGEGISKLAARLVDRIDKIGITRATQMARYETSFAFNNAAITRYKQYGIKMVEWLAASGDERTCDECLSYDGKQYKIDEVPMCPAHVGCRCTIIAVR